MKKGLLLAALLLTLGGAAFARRFSRGDARFGLCRLAFELELARSEKELRRQARTGLSSVYYFTSYYLHGMLSAYEATGDERLLRRALSHLDALEGSAVDFRARGRRFRVWGPFAVNAGSPVPKPDLHYTFQASVPLARAAALIRADPRLDARYGQAARRYEAFVDQLVFGYFYGVQLDSQVPWLDPDRFPIWNDNASNLALNAAYLCRATGARRPCALAETIGQAFRAKLAPYKSGWIWENQTIPIGSDTDNTPGSVGNQAGVPDTSHSNREAFLMVALAEMGLVFGRPDLERMADTLTGTIWNGSLESPSFSNYLDGSDKAYRVYKRPGLNGAIYHGWVLMGAYSPKAREVMLAAIKAIALGRGNGALERNSTSFGGRVALCGHSLRSFFPPPLPPPTARFAARSAP
jgi:hypothetical protein